MINTIFWIIFGGFIGWVASITINRDTQQSTLMNIGIGIVGALVAGGIFVPIFGIADVTRNNFSIAALGVALLGALILLVLLNFFRWSSLRQAVQSIINHLFLL